MAEGNGDERTTLSRIYSKSGELIYGGIAANLGCRLVQRATQTRWWAEMDRSWRLAPAELRKAGFMWPLPSREAS